VMLPVIIFLIHARSSRNVSLDIPSGVAGDTPRIGAQPISLLTAIRNLGKGLYFTSSVVLGHPLLEQIIEALKLNWLTYTTGIISVIIILSLPPFLWRSASANGLRMKDDMTLGLSFLPLSLVVVMIGISFATSPYYLTVVRYYEPVGLCGIFIFYRLANGAKNEIVKKASKAIVLMFVLYVCAYAPALALTGGKDSLNIHVLSFTPSASSRFQSTSQRVAYPSFMLYSKKESTKTKVKQLYRDNPQALFYAQNYMLFIYDEFEGGPAPGKTFRVFPHGDFWSKAYTTRPVKIFWVLNQASRLDFVSASNQVLVFADPIERTKILVSDFPAGKLSSGEPATQTR
jgi:hypothetical protein